jgi:hypothetical protein
MNGRQSNSTVLNGHTMHLTDYQSQYFAYELTRRYSSDKLEKLAGTFAGAQVDINPHQVDAALFAFQSPLSKGALLADEVGLGKTIEAGLVIAQKWAERTRRILVITPANLRKQWQQELTEKFFLPCKILESKSYKAEVKAGVANPFDTQGAIMLCSYQFARGKETEVRSVLWDLVVIDEAHRLRNVYKPTNVIANTLKRSLEGRHKLLLTATPFQNSLLELYGLASFIDDRSFGDLKSFREQFSSLRRPHTFEVLKERLKPLCHRTLRRQVTAYVPFTKRHALLEEFTPEESEDRLYHLVSKYLQRDNLQALPAGQRSLITLVLRKLLASSTFAIAGALTSMSNRLKEKQILSQFEKRLMQLTRHELNGKAHFLDGSAFELLTAPALAAPEPIPLGRYELPRRTGEAHTYRLGHSLAEAVIAQAKQRDLAPATIQFDYDGHEGKVTILESLRGHRGVLSLSLLTVEVLDQVEERLIFAAITDEQVPLDEEQAERLLSLPGKVAGDGMETTVSELVSELDQLTQQRKQQLHQEISERNAAFFQAEAEKLDSWADDLKVVLERDLKDLDRQIKEAKQAATAALTLEEKLAGQKRVKELEKLRNQKRRSLFDAQDEVDEQRDRLIAQIEGKLEQKSELKPLFTIQWSLG